MGEGYVAIVTALITAAVTLTGAYWMRRKSNSEANKADADGAQALSNAAVVTVKMLEDRLVKVEKENEVLRAENAALKCEVDRLKDNLAKLQAQYDMLRLQLTALTGKAPGQS